MVVAAEKLGLSAACPLRTAPLVSALQSPEPGRAKGAESGSPTNRP